jgi:ABC-2 type transport system ATP-binding protein
VALLEISGLTVQRGTRTVLENLDLTIESGECVLLVGENGAGKSTLIESIVGLLPIHSGGIEVRRPFGLTFQSGGMHGDELVSERLGFCAETAGVSGAKDLLSRWNLEHRREDRIGHLSGGMRRRLAVIQGLMPAYGEGERICLLDEPSEGLDEASVHTLIGDLAALRARGHAFLIASHDPRLEACASHILTLDGKKVEHAPAAEPSDPPVLASAEANIPFNRWSATLDRRTLRPALSRGVPLIAAILVLFALLGKQIGALLLLPAFLAALAPHTSLHHVKEERSGDWWRAMGACLSAPDAFSTLLILAAPWLTATIFGVPNDGWIWLAMGLPFLGVLLASGAIHELAERLPRENSQYIPLLTLVLIWPLLIASDALDHATPWQPLLLASGIGLVISVAMPLFHPRTGSN